MALLARKPLRELSYVSVFPGAAWWHPFMAGDTNSRFSPAAHRVPPFKQPSYAMHTFRCEAAGGSTMVRELLIAIAIGFTLDHGSVRPDDAAAYWNYP
jgi:hypothetical protein